MRRIALWVCAMLAASSALAAADAAVDRTAIVGRQVAQLSSASLGSGYAQHVALTTARPCAKVGVWRLTKAPQILGPSTCEPVPFALTLGGAGALWATVRTTTGDRRIWEVWLSDSGRERAGGSAGSREPYDKPELVVRRAAVRGEPAPVVMYEASYWVDGVLRGLGARLDRPPVRVAFGGGAPHAAVQHASGVIDVYLGSSGTLLGSIAYAPGVVKAMKGDSRGGLFLVLTPGRLDLRNFHSSNQGEIVNTVDLPGAASYGDDRCYRPTCASAELRLADFDWPYAVYVHGRAVHFVDMRDGRDLVVRRPPESPVHAQLEPGGLTYSHGNRVSYVGRRTIDALFR